MTASRDDIVRRFEQWLDEALAATDPPSGIDAEILASLTAEASDESGLERRSDAFALWATVTALTQEVKLQGRAFKELREGLVTEVSRLAEAVATDLRGRERDIQREAERRCRRDILGALVDLRDRLGRGRDSVRPLGGPGQARPLRWLPRLWSGRAEDYEATRRLTALARGFELGLERLDRTLDDFGARPIQSEGQLFDARRMEAVDTGISSDVPEGTVLEVYRAGYEWNGEVFRPAQVKVSRRPEIRS